MKRKLIQTLLTTGHLNDEVLKLLPGDMPPRTKCNRASEPSRPAKERGAQANQRLD